MSPRTRNGSLDRPLRIALVNLRSSGDDWHQIVMVPLGLMYLSAVLREAYGERLRIALFDMTLLEHGVDPLTGVFIICTPIGSNS